MSDPEIVLHTPASNDLIDALHERLADSGQALRENEFETFILSVNDSTNKITAGCKGEIAFHSLHITEVWVDERHRGKGMGSALLSKAEAYAVERGCTRLHLETRSEAARRLYEKIGYTVFGKLPNYDGDTPFYYLEKRLG